VRTATSQIAQTTLRSVLGKADLDMLLSERERLNESLQQIIDDQTDPWGIKVTTVEIKDVGIPAAMQRAMARQAEAERERRAKVINAEGEYQAAERLYDAAEILSGNPAALQLRYLQTLIEVGGSENSTIVFPLPIDLIKPLLGDGGADDERRRPADKTGRLSRTEEPDELPEPERGSEQGGRLGPGRAPGEAPAPTTPQPERDPAVERRPR
jgi:hypothetical protein